MDSKRKKFMRTVPGPYICHFCGEPITVFTGQKGDSLNGHHMDGNHDNDDPKNWVATHSSCHTKHHKQGTPQSEAHRSARSEAMLGNTNGKWGRAGKPV